MHRILSHFPVSKKLYQAMVVCIIGAGIAGLQTAVLLQDRLGGERIVVIESQSAVGGRVRTQRSAAGAVQYERGPWRIAESHERALQLCRDFGVALHRSSAPPPKPAVPEPKAGLSIWDVHLLRSGGNPRRADALDLATGYAGQTRAASGSSPYLVGAKQYYVATGGLDQLTTGLARRFNGELWLDARVTDVVKNGRGFAVHVSRRKGHNEFETTRLDARAVVVATPPHAWRPWSIARRCRSVLAAVRPAPLHHIYARSRATAPRRHTISSSAAAAQRIPSQYGNAWHQVSYTSGRLADFWHRLRQSDPTKFSELLGHPLGKLRSHYWPRAFHMWRPAFHFDLDRAVATSVQPNPAELPGLYLANESHSSHQAWMEGALEMAERVVGCFDTVLAESRRSLPNNHVVHEGWVLDVSAWCRAHPGSSKAIRNHLGEDISELHAHIGHSDDALAVIHSLKIMPFYK